MGKPDRARYERIASLIGELEKTSGTYGIDLRGALQRMASGESNEFSRALESVIERHIRDDLSEQAVDLNRKLQDLTRTQRIKNEVAASANPFQTLQNRILSPALTGWSMESAGKARLARTLNQTILREVRDNVDPNFQRAILNADDNAVVRNLFDISNGGKGDGSPEAKIAEIVFRAREQQRMEMAGLGLKMPADGMPFVPQMDWRKLQAMGKDRFVALLANAMHPDMGTPELRADIASRLWDNVEAGKGTVRWRDFEGDEVPPVKWASADALIAFRNEVSSEGMLASTLTRELPQLTRRAAAADFWGPNYRRNFNTLIEELRAENKITAQQEKALRADFDSMVDVAVPESFQLNQWLATYKNLQISSKLGSAVVMALMDAPTMIWVTRSLLRIKDVRAINDLFSGFRSAETREAATLFGSFEDGVLNHLSNRMDVNLDATGRIVEKSAAMANLTMKLQGLNWWTNATKAGGTNMLLKHFGSLVGKPWSELDPQFRRVAERFDIGEATWNSLDKSNLQANGAINVFTLPTDLRDRFTAFVQEQVNTMVITASQRDARWSQLNMTPGSKSAAIASAIMQFTSTPIAMGRKQYARAFQEYGAVGGLASVAQLVAWILPIALLGTQARELTRGNKPFAWDDPQFLVSAVASAGIGGYFGDFLYKNVFESRVQDMAGISAPRSAQDVFSLLGPIGQSAGGVLAGLEAIARGVSGNDDWEKPAWKFTRNLLQMAPGQNLWWTMGAWRYFMIDNVHSMIDPEGYSAAQSRQQEDASRRQQSWIDGTSVSNPAADFSWRSLLE